MHHHNIVHVTKLLCRRNMVTWQCEAITSWQTLFLLPSNFSMFQYSQFSSVHCGSKYNDKQLHNKSRNYKTDFMFSINYNFVLNLSLPGLRISLGGLWCLEFYRFYYVIATDGPAVYSSPDLLSHECGYLKRCTMSRTVTESLFIYTIN